MRLFTLVFVLYFLVPPTYLQLLINVKNQVINVLSYLLSGFNYFPHFNINSSHYNFHKFFGLGYRCTCVIGFKDSSVSSHSAF